MPPYIFTIEACYSIVTKCHRKGKCPRNHGNGKKSDHIIAVSKVVAAVVGTDGRLVRPLGAPHRLTRRCQCSPFLGAAATFLGGEVRRGGAVRGGQPAVAGEGRGGSTCDWRTDGELLLLGARAVSTVWWSPAQRTLLRCARPFYSGSGTRDGREEHTGRLGTRGGQKPLLGFFFKKK
jgi:hypothetical protein